MRVRITTDAFQAAAVAKGTEHVIAHRSGPVYFTDSGFALFSSEFDVIDGIGYNSLINTELPFVPFDNKGRD